MPYMVPTEVIPKIKLYPKTKKEYNINKAAIQK
jgi:hypothetical protein